MIKDFCFFHPREQQLGPIKTTLNNRAIKAIIAAIKDAWNQLEVFKYYKSGQFDHLHYLDEDELTTKLAEILNDKLSNNVDVYFRKENFQTVIRDGKQSTSSTNSTEQMPDLTFRMIKSMPGEDVDESAFFVEAKLVAAENGCRQYVVEGLYRFISGKYAPRMSIGLMLGYGTKNFLSADTHLPAYFTNATSTEALQCKAEIIAAKDIDSDCYTSKHKRSNPCPPDFISIHLWLTRPLD